MEGALSAVNRRQALSLLGGAVATAAASRTDAAVTARRQFIDAFGYVDGWRETATFAMADGWQPRQCVSIVFGDEPLLVFARGRRQLASYGPQGRR